jgi:transcriptional regulator with XRE-family HTH domain
MHGYILMIGATVYLLQWRLLSRSRGVFNLLALKALHKKSGKKLEAHDPLVLSLLKLIHSLRKDQGLTLEDLADRANVHRTTVGLLERHERTPSVSVASQLANALGYSLSDLLAKSELIAEGKISEGEAFREEKARQLVDESKLRNPTAFEEFTGLPSSSLLTAIQGTYHTLDMIDDQLVSRGSAPIAGLVELANLSSMVGNLVGGCLADASNGLYERNRPHRYPDLLSLQNPLHHLELKVALETNRPKGHLPKPGRYITFRYSLGDRSGKFTRGKASRGQTVWIWEARIGVIHAHDYDNSNTEGDSGKTSTIKTTVFQAMPVVFFDRTYCPHPMRQDRYPGFN